MVVFSKSKNAKKMYDVITPNGKIISFGRIGMKIYNDSTNLCLFSHLNSNDDDHRHKIKVKMLKKTDKFGNLTVNDKQHTDFYVFNYLY
jgi:hypothetical protein